MLTSESIRHIPNILSSLRIIMGFVIAYIIHCHIDNNTILAIYIIAIITDYLDGWFARKYDVCDIKWGVVSGYWLDKIGDRIIMICIYSALIVKNWGFAMHIICLSLLNAYEIAKIICYRYNLYRILTKSDVILGRRLNQILYFIQCVLISIYLLYSSTSTHSNTTNVSMICLCANIICATIYLKYYLI